MRLLQVRARQTQSRSNHTDSIVCAHCVADQGERDNYYASVANVVNNDVMNTWKAALSKRSRAKIFQFSVIWTSGINTESAGVLILQKKAIVEAGPVFVHNTKSDNDNQRQHLPLCQVQVNSSLPQSSIQVVWEVAVRGAVLQVTKSPPSPLIHYSQT